MAVDPTYRGRGVGTSLLLDAELRAREMGCQYLYADTMQYQAPQFYTNRGFQIVGQIPDWDSHGHTKFFLTKNCSITAPRWWSIDFDRFSFYCNIELCHANKLWQP